MASITDVRPPRTSRASPNCARRCAGSNSSRASHRATNSLADSALGGAPRSTHGASAAKDARCGRERCGNSTRGGVRISELMAVTVARYRLSPRHASRRVATVAPARRRPLACRTSYDRPSRSRVTPASRTADASARAPNGGDHTLGTATGNADHGDPAQNDRHRGDGLRRKPLTRE